MAKIRDGSTYLAKHLSCNDYYAEGEKVTGHWCGQLTSRLGITDGQHIHSDDRTFRMLRQNVNPASGEKLTQRTVQNGVRFFDFQCSCQKSVSLVHALAGDERLAAAHDRAAAEAFAELESFAACRVRGGDAAWSHLTRRTGNLCAATFRHDCSRALDPQLHTHHVVANATWDETQNRMVALESCEMLQAIRYAGKVYQNALAREVQALGYGIEEVRGAGGVIEGFEIAGVSRELLERYSKRRAEVEAGIDEFEQQNGRAPSRREIDVITRQTRSAKMAEVSTPDVRAAQVAQLTKTEHAQLLALTTEARGRERQTKIRSFGKPPMPTGESELFALQAAIAHRFERASVLTGHHLLAEALNTSLGTLDVTCLKSLMHTDSAGLIALSADEHLPSCQFATRDGLALERWSIQFVADGIGQCEPLLGDGVQVASWLADEQKEAVDFIGNSHDQIMAVRGVAGAGKTTMLTELHRHLLASKHKILYLAPTASAVAVLKKEGFSAATTVSAYLEQVQSGRVPPAWRGAVVIVDEASLLSNRQGAALLGTAALAGQRIVFVGDTRQHASVEAGDFLRVLEDHSPIDTRTLSDIRRQLHTEYNHAVRLLSDGQAAAGIECLAQMGWIKDGEDSYLEQAAAEYLRLSAFGDGADEKVICVAPTWAENHALTAHIRAGLHMAGKLSGIRAVSVVEPSGWTTQQRRNRGNYRLGQIVTFNRRVPGGFAKDVSLEIERIEAGCLVLTGGRKLDPRHASSYDVGRWRAIELAAGDKILLRRNRKKPRLINGQLVTVAGFDSDGSIRTSDGKIIPADYRHFAHGYAITSHKSQGHTVDHVLVAAERLDAKSAYVACSRGRKTCTVYTPDRGSLIAGLSHSGDRQAALDVLLRGNEAERRRQSAHQTQVLRAEALAKVLPMEVDLHAAAVEITMQEYSESVAVNDVPSIDPPAPGRRRVRSR